ncbi:MAG: CvpA family protein [Bacillota bacterium]|nr:CvpA family protein [Bacillota bacterium]
MNLLDAVVLLLLAAGAWGGYRRGLISTAGGLFGFFGGIWLAGLYYLPFAGFLGERLGMEKILTRILIPFCAGVPGGGFTAAIPVGSAGPAGALPTGFPPALWEPWLGLKSGIGGSALAQLLAGAIVKLIAFFLIWAVFGYLVGLLAAFITRVAHLFFLGGINRLAGLGLGLVTRALGLVVVIGMLNPIVLSFALGLPAAGGWGEAFANSWRNSLLVPYFTQGWNAAAPALQYFFRAV